MVDSTDWITRETADGYEINLSAPPETLVPLVRGQRVGPWDVPETRNYRIDEIVSFAKPPAQKVYPVGIPPMTYFSNQE